MKNGEDKLQPIFSHVEPVLAVQDVPETVFYWQDTLGFPTKWIWDPPNHGGVSWHGVFIQFSQNPGFAAASKGNSVWIRVRHLDTLYALRQEKNTEIIAPLENQPWGMAQYTIREINGYFVHFAGHIADREKSEATLLQTIRITGRVATAKNIWTWDMLWMDHRL